MKLTLVLRYFTVGGLERVVSALANGLVARGIDTQVVVMWPSRRNALIVELDERVDLVFLSGSLWKKMHQLKACTGGRLVHLHFGDGKIHPLARWSLRHALVVTTYHSVYSHKRNFWTNRLDRYVSGSGLTERLFAVSEAVAAFCREEVSVPDEKLFVIPNGVVHTPLEQPPNAVEPIGIISLASLYPHKNHLSLIGGLMELNRRGRAFRLHVVGDGPTLPELYRAAKEGGILPSVEWHGAIWKKELVDAVFVQCPILVSASRFEGMPLSIIEAMNKGCALVLSDIDAHRELAGEGAIYFPPDDACALADAVASVLEDATVLAEWRQKSAALAGDYSAEKMVDSYVLHYREVWAAQREANLEVLRTSKTGSRVTP